jgi:hypothetical protein
MANNRIFYASQAVALKPQNADGTAQYSNWYFPRGVQSAGITTNFGLEQVFQLGQIELYENVEDVPEVEVTMNKVIDGTPPLYLLCMGGSAGITGANGKELVNLANNRVNFRLGVWSDTLSAATGSPVKYVDCSGMYLSSVSYTIPVDGNSTEDVTLVGNNKYWNKDYIDSGMTSVFSSGTNNDAGTMTAPAIARRFKYNKTDSVVPSGIGGDRLQSVTISTDLGREAINELGAMAPYFRYVNFPVEVTSEFEIVGTSGDLVEAEDFTRLASDCTTQYTNLPSETVRIVICGSGSGDKLGIDLGNKNKLTSVNYTGGDTGGGNATITYSYQSFNKLTVTGSGTFIQDAWVDTVNDAIVGD